MNEKDIRIGNDIRIFVTLRSQLDKNNIKYIKAYLINTTLREAMKNAEEDPWNHVRRFPRDPQSKFFRPDEHCLNRCGYPHYHAFPMDHDPNYVFDDGFHRPFWPYPFDCHCDPHFYHGFGLEPGRWPHRWFGWTDRPEPGFAHRAPGEPIPLHMEEDFSFLAPSKVVDGENRVEVFFPAQDQIACGTYKLVIVTVAYEAGWGRNNLHTYTFDYGAQFNLVDSENGIQSDGDAIEWDADEVRVVNRKLGEVKSAYPHFYIYEGQTLRYGDRDAHGHMFNISCRVAGGDYAVYSPTDWRYDSLIFESDNAKIASVQNFGAYIVAGIYDHNRHDTIIRVTSSSDPTLFTKFQVTVMRNNISASYTEAKFAPEKEVSEVSPEGFVEQQENDFVITNSADGDYLWIRTASPLKHIDNNGKIETIGVTSSRFNVPMESYGYYNDYYYYRSSGAVKAGDMNIHLEFDSNE